MARRESEITISFEGRDNGKVFHLTEMPADQSERWAIRALLAMTKNGVEIPDEVIANPSLAGVAAVGIRALGKIDAPAVLELFDEMMRCVHIYPDKLVNPTFHRALVNGNSADIDEVATILFLRMEVISLHLGFSLAAKVAEQRALVRKMREEAEAVTLQNTKTSRRRSRL